ncbi:hypothetical protein Y032_0069g311 [Ancylostoma ceylanicum]|uniref:Uncharacterized protein n=1 Tax=Ancylostoma ceylanicum TaxID=53326 RepID=A0A016TXS5_9BILA|nr:hypothetical protein Y032_0069g311 [Ancylostoma ceylanicum]
MIMIFSRHSLAPDFEEELLTLLGTPGIYDLTTIENMAGVGAVIKLESINAASRMLVKGDWQSISTLVSDGQVVARVKAPSNGDWLYVN